MESYITMNCYQFRSITKKSCSIVNHCSIKNGHSSSVIALNIRVEMTNFSNFKTRFMQKLYEKQMIA